MKLPFLIWLLAALAAFCAPAQAQFNMARTDQVRVVFGTPKTAQHQAIRDELQARGVVDRVRMLVSPFRLPRMLTLEVRGCDGNVDAFYGDDVATLCYEYIELIQKHSPKVAAPGGVGPGDVMAANVMDTLLHEVGHAVFDILEIPVLGREEDAADFFSAYLLLQFEPEDARRLVIGVGFMLASEAREELVQAKKPSAFAGAHGLPAQRYYNLLCMTYGKDPDVFFRALSVGQLPKDRAEGCDDEYALLERSFQKLILPHIDETRLRRAIADMRFNWQPLVTAEGLDPVPLAE
jgi:hypothetical protein